MLDTNCKLSGWKSFEFEHPVMYVVDCSKLKQQLSTISFKTEVLISKVKQCSFNWANQKWLGFQQIKLCLTVALIWNI